MAFTLVSELLAARTALEVDGRPVFIRATMPPGAELPASGTHLVVDVVPTAPSTTFNGTIYEDLALQVSVWSDVNLTTALAAAEDARGRMETLNYVRSAGTQLVRDETYAGVILTFTLPAAFGNIDS